MGSMRSEAVRIADQLQRAMDGPAWHGPALREILRGVDGAVAARRPESGAHSIWELVLHIRAWDLYALRRIGGEEWEPSEDENFPRVAEISEEAWAKAQAELAVVHSELVAAMAKFPEVRLGEKVPGRDPDYHTFYYMLHGAVQHMLYHAGQIAVLKKG